MAVAAEKKSREAVRALSAHPRWPALIEHLTARRDQLVAKMLKEAGSDSDVIRLQGRAYEATVLLNQLVAMAKPEGEEDQNSGDDNLIA